MIKDRLKKEVENNVTLTLQPSNDSESINVQGRGELQIGDKTYIVSCLKTYYSQLNNNYWLKWLQKGILVETLRREGFELTISPPKVLAVKGEDGISREPFEEVVVDIDPELQGQVIESMVRLLHSIQPFIELWSVSRHCSQYFTAWTQSIVNNPNKLLNNCNLLLECLFI